MLRKLLKYDFKAVMKYWWIAAITTLIFSLLGGGCFTIFASPKEFSNAVYFISALVLILVFFSYAFFTILSMILVFVRFYRNFFSDEGYLTFTLPVKRSQLLNSKLIMSTVVTIATSFVFIFDIVLMIVIGFSDELFTKTMWYNLSYLGDLIKEEIGWYLIIYIIEFLLFLLLTTVLSILILFCCITIASIITKKARVITAIGIYYVASAVYSLVVQIFFAFGIGSLSDWLTGIPVAYENGILALVVFGVLLFMAIFCMLIYLLQYWMIDRKLNMN